VLTFAVVFCKLERLRFLYQLEKLRPDASDGLSFQECKPGQSCHKPSSCLAWLDLFGPGLGRAKHSTSSVWLGTNLRKIRTPNGADQSKVKFSKRKPVFSARSLIVGVPFHSQHFRDATDKIANDDLNGEELWTPEGLHIPVYHAEDGKSMKLFFYLSLIYLLGSDLRTQTGSLTYSICD
jgi:hypothetical protein